MAGTRTASYKIYKPEVGADADTWGGRLNQGWDDTDAIATARATTGSSNAYVLSSGLTTAISAYATGQSFLIIPNFTNTGAATINVDTLGAKNITKNGAAALVSGDLVSGTVYRIVYDGTQFQIVGGVAQPLDATLTAFAALTISAGTYIRGTGADAFAVDSYATVKSNLSLNNVENKSSATIRSEITSINLVAAAGVLFVGGAGLNIDLGWNEGTGKIDVYVNSSYRGSITVA